MFYNSQRQYLNTSLPRLEKCEEKLKERKRIKNPQKSVQNVPAAPRAADILQFTNFEHGNQFRYDCRVLNSKTVDFIIIVL